MEYVNFAPFFWHLTSDGRGLETRLAVPSAHSIYITIIQLFTVSLHQLNLLQYLVYICYMYSSCKMATGKQSGFTCAITQPELLGDDTLIPGDAVYVLEEILEAHNKS